MRPLSKLIDLIVVTMCLPMYAVAIPLMVWADSKAARRIAAMTCPWCHKQLDAITRHDITNCGVMLRLAPGTRVIWDRLPTRSMSCPSCSKEICFDRKLRPTACDRSDAITKRSHST